MLLGIGQCLCFGVTTEQTTLGAALQKDICADARPVRCREGFERVHTAQLGPQVDAFHASDIGFLRLIQFVVVVSFGHCHDACRMHSTGHDFLSLLRSQAIEPDCIPTDTNREVGELFWMGMRLSQHVRAKNINVQMVSLMGKVSIQQSRQILESAVSLSQSIWQQAKCVGNAVHTLGVRKFRNGGKRRQGTVLVTAVHWICTGGECFALHATVGGRPRGLSVNQIGCNCENGESGLGSAIQWLFIEFFMKSRNYLDSKRVHAVVIVTVLWNFPIGVASAETNREAVFISNGVYFIVFQGSHRVCDNGKTRNAKCHQAIDVGIMQSHLNILIACTVVRIMNAIHCVGVKLGHPRDRNVKKETFHVFVVDGAVLITGTDAQFLALCFQFGTEFVSMELVSTAVQAHQ
mmetsp:Transcript_19615/g.31597  ORF Transcript_19615/g.31597 Transcript_19615/m.31597 type:complete len:406 (-) Transcript_19615:649-1866(-)